MDYDIYAEGEAELGWLNCTVRLEARAGEEFPLDELLLDLVSRLERAFVLADAEPAHLKVLGTADGATAIANLVSSGGEVELSVASGARVPAVELTINARVAIDPQQLTELVRSETSALAADRGLTHALTDLQSFRPGRPMPTHRMPLGQS
jgi:hypothetical protein